MSKIPAKIKFTNKPEDEMIIAAYVEPLMYERYEEWGADVTVDEAFDDLKASGCNTLIQTESALNKEDDSVTINLFEQTDKRKLNLLFKDYNVVTKNNRVVERTVKDAEKYFKTAYSKFEKYSSFAGLHFIDEPGYKDWVKFAPIEKAFKNVYPDKTFYLNLLQVYAPHWAFPNGPVYLPGTEGWLPDDPDYIKYYESYMSEMSPEMFSYDHYPITKAFPHVEDNYFLQLHLSKKYAEQANIPLFAFIQVGKLGHEFGRTPSDEELRWQVNCAIAYNTKHIGWFTYWTFLVGYPHWRNMMVSEHGNKTKQWYRVQKINEELLFQDEYFLNAGFVGYIQTGKMPSTEKPVECDRLKTFGKLKSLSGGNLFIGCFEYVKDGKTYNMYYVVNNSILEDANEVLSFKKSIKYTKIHRKIKTTAKGNSVEINLTPGDACIIIEDLK